MDYIGNATLSESLRYGTVRYGRRFFKCKTENGQFLGTVRLKNNDEKRSKPSDGAVNGLL